MELMISPASPPTQDFRFHSAATSPYATAPSSPHRLGLAGAGANPLASADGMAGGPFLGSTATAPSSPDQFELLPPATPRLTGANPFDLFQHFTSAPASPGRAAAMYAHFTEGNNGLDGSDDEEGEDDFRPRASYSTAASAVPFDWEEKPGTPKAGFAGDTTNGAEEEDFEFGTHFDKSAPPPKLTTADELFVKGKIRPLKPPPGLLDGGSVGSSPRSPMTKAPMWSPRRRSRVGSGLDFDPFTAALLETTKSPSPLGGKDAATNTRSGPLTQKPDTKSGWRRKWRLSDLLLFRSSSEGRVNKDPIFKCSPAHPPAEPVKKIMSPEPTMAKGKGNSMGKPKKLGKKDGMAAAEGGMAMLHRLAKGLNGYSSYFGRGMAGSGTKG